MVTKAIERAQKQVEAQNFATRKHLLEYDDVMNKQRENVYTLRRELLEGQIKIDEDEVVDSRGYVIAIAEELVEELVETHAGKDQDGTRTLARSRRPPSDLFGIEPDEPSSAEPRRDAADRDRRQDLRRWRWPGTTRRSKALGIDAAILRRVERDIMLQIVDAQWKDHLYSLDHLKEGIGLRGYGQRDPLVEYKKESFALFQAMKARIDEEMVRYLWRLRPVMSGRRRGAAPAAPVRRPRRSRRPLTFSGGSSTTAQPSAGRAAHARRARAATMRRSRRCAATNRRSAATIRATAAAARSTRSATERRRNAATMTDRLGAAAQVAAGLPEALTFDDILLLPRHSTRPAQPGRHQLAVHAAASG